MSPPKHGLGRGLNALIPPGAPVATIPGVREIELAQIIPNPRQPRQKINSNELRELAASIKEHGILQPLVVTTTPDSTDTAPRFQLIAGERRMQAAKLAGLKRVPVIVRGATPEEMLELALIENIQREDLNALEEANAYRQMLDDFNLTQEQVAAKVGKDRATVANSLRLLKLPEEFQFAIARGDISEGHARALLGLQDEQQRRAFLRATIEKGYSVRQLEEAVRRANEKGHKRKKKIEHEMPAATRALEEEFRKALGTKVQLSRSRKGGKIIVHFYSEEELESVYEKIVGKRQAR
ncbi:MAG: ParB/RepB/Spo0J family partition protein [Chloroflexi bacterium]|nr:ParB/RepB/Spo0J family partition protein [Chloroflexota bacterium]MBI3742536.1 ParB/RepB/Spo0J family partition protein [Chloroflexota bacterium]